VVVGDVGVGKTSALIAFTTHEFKEFSVPTLLDRCSTQFRFGDSLSVQLDLWDTVGCDENNQIKQLIYDGTSVVMLMFKNSGTNEEFANVTRKWIPEIRHYCGADVPIILCCT